MHTTISSLYQAYFQAHYWAYAYFVFDFFLNFFYQVLLLTSLFRNNLFHMSFTHLLNKQKYKVWA